MAHLQLVEGKRVTLDQLEDFVRECHKRGIPGNVPIKVAQDGGLENTSCTCIIAEEDGITLYDWI